VLALRNAYSKTSGSGKENARAVYLSVLSLSGGNMEEININAEGKREKRMFF